MVGAFSTHGRNEKSIKFSVGKSEENRPLRRRGRRWPYFPLL
jgi:hypothetical protein